ncbi:hypothetical protein [Azospirillum argentinense]
MYAFFAHLHSAASLLSLAATLAWGWAAMNHSAGAGMTGRRKGLYVAAMATTGFAGLTGLAITFAGPWSQMLFPYVGVAAVAGHGMAGKAVKGALMRGGRGITAFGVSLQAAILLAAAGIMATKPF